MSEISDMALSLYMIICMSVFRFGLNRSLILRITMEKKKKQHINYLFLLPTNPFWSNLYDLLTLLCPSIALIFLDSQKRVISVGAWLWFSLSSNNM